MERVDMSAQAFILECMGHGVVIMCALEMEMEMKSVINFYCTEKFFVII